jgi:hypothetical protein
MRVEEKVMINAICISRPLLFRARLAHSKAHVCVEIHFEQERSAVQPIIVSTSGCFERCDVQIILCAIGCVINLDEIRDFSGRPFWV